MDWIDQPTVLDRCEGLDNSFTNLLTYGWPANGRQEGKDMLLELAKGIL